MRTGQWKTMGIGSLIGKMIYAVFGLAASMLCIMGYYPVLYMGKQALQRMDGRNDCGNYHDRDEYIGTSDSEYGEKGIDPWHQRRCDRVCTGSIVPLWNRNGQSDFPGET